MSNTLRFGDIVTLKNVKLKSYICAEGILGDDLVVGKMESFEDNLFQICLPRQYSAALELDEFLTELEMNTSEGEINDSSSTRHLEALRRGLANEDVLNEQYMRLKFGSAIHFGDAVQLLHLKSKKYITVIGTEIAEQERANIKVNLHPTGSLDSWMVIEPQFKINQQGDQVHSNSEIKFRVSERNPSEYLHCAESGYSSSLREVNSSMEATCWLLNIFQSALDTTDSSAIHASELVYMSDPETLSVLSVFQRPPIICPHGSDMPDIVSEDDSIMELSEEGEIVLEPIEKEVSSNSLWVIETKAIISGGLVQWKADVVRLKHVNTGKYMCVEIDDDGKHKFTVATKPSNKGTLLSFHVLHSTKSFLEDKKAVQISHSHVYLERGELREVANISHYQCQCTYQKSNAIYLFISRYDAEKVERNKTGTQANLPLDVYVGCTIRNFLKEYLNAMEDFHDMDPTEMDTERLWPSLNVAKDKEFYKVIGQCIEYLKGYAISDIVEDVDVDADSDDVVNEFGECVRDDVVIERRQNMFREQGTIGIILLLLNSLLPLIKPDNSNSDEDKRDNSDDEHDFDLDFDECRRNLLKMASQVSSMLLRLLLQCVKRHTLNQIYVAGHMHVVLGWVGVEHIAAEVVKEMLSDNLELQTEHIGADEVTIFTDQICNPKSNMKSMYFTMLKSFCSCSGHAISRNQGYVMDSIFPVLDKIFMKVNCSKRTSLDYDREFFFPSIYIPSKYDDVIMLGVEILTEGIPELTITWRTENSDLTPQRLFGKEYVPLSEFARSNRAKRNFAAVSGSLSSITTNITKPTGPVIKRSRSASFLDSSKLRKRSVLNQSSFKESTKLNDVNVTVANKEAVLDYFTGQMFLAAEICLDRNYMGISEMEKLYPYDYLIAILLNVSMGNKTAGTSNLIRAVSNLIQSLYVDRESESTQRLPYLSRVFSCLNEANIVASVDGERLYRFAILQQFLSNHLKHIKTDGGPWEAHSLSIVSILHKLVDLHFYGSIEMLNDVIVPIMTALNRKNHDIDRKEFMSAAELSRQKSALGRLENLRNVVPYWQKTVLLFLESTTELVLILLLVIISAIITLVQIAYNLEGIEFLITNIVVGFIFLAEVTLRGYCHNFVRKNWSKFFYDPYVQLDIFVVVLDIALLSSQDVLGSFGDFSSSLRVLRMLRLLRIIRAARALKPKEPDDIDEKEKWRLPARYRTAPAHELSTMVEMVDTLFSVQRLVDNRNLTLLLRGFYQWCGGNAAFTITPGCEKKAIDVFSTVLAQANELSVSNNEYDNYLLDLLMYVNPSLVQSVLDLLMAHHTRTSIMLSNCSSVQLLCSPSRESQYRLVNSIILQLDRFIETFALWGNGTQDKDKEISSKCCSILDTLKTNCRVRRDVLEFDYDYEEDLEMQCLLRNFGCWDVCWKLLSKLSMALNDNSMSSSNRNTVAIMAACNDLLFWYAFKNPVNQEQLFEQLDFFLSSVDKGISSHKVVKSIFMENESLMRRVPAFYIADFAENISKLGRFPQYLSLLSSITSAGGKNILENQYEIVKQISSPLRQKKILVYFCPVTHFEYSKKVKLMQPYLHKHDVSCDDIAAELAYHIELLRTLDGCTIGVYNVTTIETKVQAMFPFVDVIDAILDPQCILLIKIRTGLFLYNGVLDVEMRIPGLAQYDQVWKLMAYCKEVLSTARRELAQVQANGWDAPTSSRQRLEFIVVCAMLTCGFFKMYFEPVSFRREYSLTLGGKKSTFSFTLSQIDGIINDLFSYIKTVYEMNSPLLSTKHKTYFYGALEALSKAKGQPLQDDIVSPRMLPTDRICIRNELDEDRVKSTIAQFLEYINSSPIVQEEIKRETGLFLAKLNALPSTSDRTSTSTVRYEPLIKKLVDHIRSGSEIVTHSSGREKRLSGRYTRTAVWIIKLFRTMIEDVWGMTIYQRDDEGGEEQDIACESIVKTLNACGVTTLCLDLISPGIDHELVLESIRLGVAMLFKEGGALKVQQTMYKHLCSVDSEFFFLELRKIIQDLISWHDWHGMSNPDVNDDLEIPGDIIAVRFMQLMCEGHYTPNQDIMREQAGKFSSINLLDDMVAYMACLNRLPCQTSNEAGLAIGATVLEVIQGPCAGNQDHFALNTSLVEILNHQLRAQSHKADDIISELELKKNAIDIFQGLLEGQGQKTAVYERILSVIHLDVIEVLCNPQQPDPGDENKDEELLEIELSLQTESLVLLQMLCDFKPGLRNELEIFNRKGERKLRGNVASVEIVWRGELQRRFFNVPFICRDLNDSSKANFVEYVDRSSQEKKLLDMYRRASVIYTELKHQKFLKEIYVSKVFTQRNQNRATWITFSLCCAINMILLVFYDGSECFKDYVPPEDDEGEGTEVSCGDPDIPSYARSAVNTLNALQITFSSFTLVLFLVVRAPVHYITHYATGVGVVMSVIYTALDPLTMYYFVYVILAVASLRLDYILTLLLLDIAVKNSYARDVIIAVFTPIKQLMMACLLCVVVMYIFSMILFLEFNSAGALPYPDDCKSLYSCFKFCVGYGRSGDFNEDMTQRINNQWYFYFAFDIAIRFVLLNVIRGITVDTFSELRLAKMDRLRDTLETCFICGIDKQIFDRDKASEGFATHITTEHNMWNYLYFIIYIWEQDKDDDDGLEQYVRRCIESSDISWLPTNKAMCLTVADESADDITKALFHNDVEKMQTNFIHTLADVQNDVYQAIEKVRNVLLVDDSIQISPEKSLTKTPALEIVKVNSTTSPLKASYDVNSPFFRRSSNAGMTEFVGKPRDPNSMKLVIELTEIRGLTFSSRVLDSILLRVWSPCGALEIESTNCMYQDKTSLVLFDPIEILVENCYSSETAAWKTVKIQVARAVAGSDSPRFVGFMEISLSELAVSSNRRFEKTFEACVLNTECRGTLALTPMLMNEEFTDG